MGLMMLAAGPGVELHLTALGPRGLDRGTRNATALLEQTVHPSALLEARTRCHRMVRQNRVEHVASRSQRVGTRRAGRALEATLVDPRAVPGDAPEPRGQDVVQYAQSLESAHMRKVHEMG